MKPADEERLKKLFESNPARQVAEMVGEYFETLTEKGMNKSQAYDLAREFNVYLLGNVFGWRVYGDADEKDWWEGSEAD